MLLFNRYEAGGLTTLFHFGIDPFFPVDYEPQFTVAKGLQKFYSSYWGRGEGVQAIRGTYKDIPVAVDAVEFGSPGVIPRQVILTMYYYQIDEYTKRMVTAGIQYPLVFQCVALTSGGVTQQALLASGLLTCIKLNYPILITFLIHRYSPMYTRRRWADSLRRLPFGNLLPAHVLGSVTQLLPIY